jgi:hypothetical protein
VKVDPCDSTLDYVARAGKLWDRTNKTFNIGTAVNVDIVFVYAFEDIPESAREFIAQAATRKFENRMSADPGANQINSNDAVQAWADLVQEECDNADYNVVKDSYTVRRIALRRGM